MTRQIDIKAIISHIVKGDGENKCRICMGDTSEGQVYLGDTVMMDGEKSVTLAELLESITGVKVQLGNRHPNTLCEACANSTKAAIELRLFCQHAESQWHAALTILDNISCSPPAGYHTLYAIVEDQKTTIIKDYVQQQSIASVVDAFNEYSAKNTSTFLPKLKSTSQSTNKCPYCGKSYSSKRRLYVHLKESSDLKRACYICADIMMRDDLLIHLKKKHKQRAYGCVKCPTICRSRKELLDHKKNDHSNRKNKCKECQRSFSLRSKYLAHKQVHGQNICTICKKTYYNLPCFKHHIKHNCKSTSSDDSGKSSKECEQHSVNNTQSSHTVKEKIKTRQKTKMGKFICDYCGTCVLAKGTLANHMQMLHMKNTELPCDICGKLIASAKMTGHKQTHDPTCAFRCEYCGMTIKTARGYTQHVRLHTGEKPCKCKYCGEAFYSSSFLSIHVRRIHLKIKKKKYQCSMCPSQLFSPQGLNKHMRVIHMYEVPAHLKLYKCSDCDESFVTVRALLSHNRMKHMKKIQEKENSVVEGRNQNDDKRKV